jgi:hypothetical protein
MFRAINEYMAKLNIITDDSIRNLMDEYLGKNDHILNYSINIYYNRYVVDMRIKDYSVELADNIFREFVFYTAYPYSHISVRYNEGKRVRYRYVTCKEDKTGVYIDFIVS